MAPYGKAHGELIPGSDAEGLLPMGADGGHDPEMVGELAGECRTAMELGAEPAQLFVRGSEQREATLQRLRQREHSRTEPIGLVGKALDIVGALESGQQRGACRAGHVHASAE